MRLAPAAAVLILAAGAAHADMLQFTCGSTSLSVDTAKPSVTVHFANGFSETYENGTKSTPYRFVDGSETPYVSTETVSVDAKSIRFSNHYQSGERTNAVDNVIDLNTATWHHVESGKSGDTRCAKP
jgi:hypothetical protein